MSSRKSHQLISVLMNSHIAVAANVMFCSSVFISVSDFLDTWSLSGCPKWMGFIFSYSFYFLDVRINSNPSFDDPDDFFDALGVVEVDVFFVGGFYDEEYVSDESELDGLVGVWVVGCVVGDSFIRCCVGWSCDG